MLDVLFVNIISKKTNFARYIKQPELLKTSAKLSWHTYDYKKVSDSSALKPHLGRKLS